LSSPRVQSGGPVIVIIVVVVVVTVVTVVVVVIVVVVVTIVAVVTIVVVVAVVVVVVVAIVVVVVVAVVVVMSSTLLVTWQLPSMGSWSANGRWGDGGVLTWVIGAFPVLSSPSLSSHHPALAVFALPMVPVIPGITHIPRKGEGFVGVFAVVFVGVVVVFVGVVCDVAVACCWVVVSRRGGNGDGSGVLTGGAGDVASGSEVGTTMGGRDGGGGGEESSDVSRLGRVSRFG